MESCLNYKPERVGGVTVEDLRKDLFTDFSKLPASKEPVLVEKEHLQVYLRIRPLTATESEFGESQDCISVDPPDTVVLKAPRLSLTARQSEKLGPQLAQRFQFSKVYGPETTQRQIFDGTTKALVKDVLGGENSLVFTYGVTNAGKTFTFLGPESDGGILPRSLNVIFNSIVGRIYTQSNIKPHRCVDFTRLTKDQQEEEATNKKNLLKRYKESDLQKSSSSISNSACSTLLEGSSYGELDEDSLCLEDDSHVKFAVWVSFCEIYNENIHDLLDFASNTSHRRSVLRLCQDVKGNTFVKDLTWVQVNSADEAYKVLKIGRKNQSFSSTKLNSASSRSHSIFSIRIMRIEDMGVPRVQSISELSLCDLAGSERCAKTQNRGDRLKEAGNINTSLLTLGKCMNALRLSQTQSKFQQHIPFRESKLTHYLQGFFCGRGKACMIVNINQCASMYDETLNVLKFSAVAQKVVVLNPKPVLSVMPKKSAREVSMMINNVDRREWTRRSTLIGWETSLEDVQEDEDDEEMEVDEEEEEEENCEESMVENTVLEGADDQELGELHQRIKELEEKLLKEQSEKLAIESRIRDEVTTEFMELFSNMEKDYNERLQREKEIAEERAERRLEILKNLVNKNVTETAAMISAEEGTKEPRMAFLDGMIEEMQDDLAKIKRDAEAAQSCLESREHSPGAVRKLRTQLDEMAEELLKKRQLLDIKTKEMEEVQICLQSSSDQLLEANKNYENQKLRNQQLMEICQEKDEMISKLQTALDQYVEAANEDRAYIDTIKEEFLHYRNNCKCGLNDGEEKTKDRDIQQLEETLKEKNDFLAELKLERQSLEQKLKDLTEDLQKQAQACKAAFCSLETEKAATIKLTNENRALASELSDFQQTTKSRLTAIETELKMKTMDAAKLTEELQKAQAVLQQQKEEATEQSQKIKSLKLEVENLHRKLSAQELTEGQTDKCVFQETIAALRRECETMMSSSLEKSRMIMALEKEVSQRRDEMCQKQNQCNQLKQDLGALREENQQLLGRYEAERLTVEQMKKSHSELETELHGVRQQVAVLEGQQHTFTQSSERVKELEKKLGEKEANCTDLEHRLLQTQHKLDEVEKREKHVESSFKERRKEVEDNLVHKNAELEVKAQELLQSKKQVNDGLEMIERLSLDLKQKEKCISDQLSQLTDKSAKTEQMQKEIASLSEEVRILQQKLCDLEKDRDRALSAVANKEQIIEQIKTEQANKAETQQNHKICQELLAKEKLIEEMHLKLSDEKRSRTEQERLLEARLNEIDSLQGELMKLKERPDHSHQGEQEIDKPAGPLTQASVHETSVLSTEGEREKRFPKPELEITFTPLKPDRLNVRKPGDEESVTLKIKRTARKRKSAAIQNSVDSENRRNMRFRGNSRANIQNVESPAVLSKKPNLLKQKDSPASLTGRKDGTLQKIGDFIQSSPNLLGSKAKKIMAKALRSPEPENTETNNKPKRSKRKLFKTQISSPFDIPSHPIIGVDQDDKESDHCIIKRKLRTRTVKR